MAQVIIDIAGRRYDLACRDGEEAHLRAIAALVDAKAAEAEQAMGVMSESRQLLFASLLLADALKDSGARGGAAADPALAVALERLADRIEAVADRA